MGEVSSCIFSIYKIGFFLINVKECYRDINGAALTALSVTNSCSRLNVIYQFLSCYFYMYVCLFFHAKIKLLFLFQCWPAGLD